VNDRNRAIAKLEATRQQLARDITDAVLQYDGDLMDRYSTEDNTLFDMADRLYRLTNLLSVMPREPETPPEPQRSPTAFAETSVVIGMLTTPSNTIETFLERVDLGQMSAAAEVLSTLTDLPLSIADQATDYFCQRLRDDRHYFETALMSLRAQARIAGGGTRNLLSELFGIHGHTAVRVGEHLRETL
jgi:type VI protein secretion system component VasF